MLTSQQLADALRAQASNDGTIRVDDALLGITGFDDLVRSELQRPDGTLLLKVGAAAIPQSPPAAGFTLDTAVPAADDGFLSLDGRKASIAFAVGSTIDVTLTVEAQTLAAGGAAGWSFGTSFPQLAYQGYDQLQVQSTALVLATTSPAGLAFTSTLTPASVLQAAADLLGLTATLPLAGTIGRDDKGNLSMLLYADPGIPTFGIEGVLTLEDPRIAVQYAESTADDDTKQTFVEIALVATISAGSTTVTGVGDGQVVLDVSIGMPIGDPDSRIIQLAVTPRGFTASLLSLGSLVAGQSWDDFFQGPAAPLAPYFSTFGFIGYTMTFTTSAKVVSLTLRVGTLQPWTLWGSYTLQLDATWDVTFLHPGTAQTLLLHAGFDYDGKMQFDVDVYVPSLRITGRQSGDPITLSLAQVSNTLFDGAITIPEDLLTVSVAGFWIDIDKPAKTLGIGATANASIALFGVQLLAVHDMAISVMVDQSKATTTYSATLDGQISLGPITAQVDAVLSNDPKVGCTFTVHLVNETVGSMLGHLVHLVDPTYDVSFGQPWDTLLDISLDALVLKVDVTNKKVEIDYVQTIDLGFLTITQLGLSWQKNAGGPSTTKITIAGTFLGVAIGGDSGRPPLAWDPVNEKPPEVPGGGSKLLDLRYVGIGQHVGFDPAWQPKNVEAVITRMEQLALPAGGSNVPNLTAPGGLQFRSDSGWLVGADFTVLDTVKLAFVFNDPSLYGLLISLSGPRAKSFGGLKFEILYRKVTDTIGVYHIELKLPDAMRNLEFGAVSVTLPQVILDIYTNGNFRIDFGFPVGLDFSNSFSLQIFPFVGYGGFYFALLNGDTSTRVPKITNGTFNPVIEFGLALSVGVGKTIDKGVISGGLSVVVVGIVEGVIGWFNPTDAAVAKEEYYWLQGTISIVGRLYGKIDFVIIQASLSVTAYASVTLVVEAHQPILISMSVGVSVEVSVKIVFFTIHCSFSATISASFTIGSASPTPWTVASGGGGAARRQLFASRDAGLHVPQRRMFADHARLLHRALLQNRLDAGDVSLDWSVRTVFATPRPITVSAMPAFTRVDTGVAGILLLGMPNGIAPRARTLLAHRLGAADAAAPGIADVLEGLVRWAVLNARATLGETDDTLVSRNDVTLLGAAFSDDDVLAAAVDYAGNLSPFLAANYRLTLAPPPASNATESGVAAFPMPPVLTMTAGTNAPVDFGAFNGLDETTQAKMRAYFQVLAVDYEKFVASQGADGGTDGAALMMDAAATPAAEVIFEQYFAMLLRSAVKAAADVMQRYPFAMDDATLAFGIADVRTALGDPALPAMDVVSPNRGDTAILAAGSTVTLDGTQHQVAAGDSFASVAAAYNAVLPAAGQITAEAIAQQNALAGGLLAPGVAVTFNGLQWTTIEGESLDLIGARLLTRAAGATFTQQLSGLQTMAQALLAANPTVFPALDPIVALRTPITTGAVLTTPGAPFATYTTVPGDTFISIAASILALSGTAVDLYGFTTWVAANNTLTVTDPALPQPVGTTLKLPPTAHTIQTGESIDGMALLMLTTEAVTIASLLAVPTATNLLSAQAMLDMPPLAYAVRDGDSFNTIAALFNLTLDGLADALDASGTKVFAPGAQVVVADPDQMTMDRLAAALAATQWTTVAPMASRFILSGLRLPDPNDPAFKAATLEQMQDPAVLGAIGTLPLYAQTGQQFAVPAAPPADYTIALAPDAGAPAWVVNTTPVSFPLGSEQLSVIAELAAAGFDPAVELMPLPLYRLAPTRYTLQKHVAWQPASLPADAVYAPSAAGSVTGHPDIWMFPDALVSRLQADGATQPPYTVSVGTHETAQSGMTVAGSKAFAWATSLRVSIQQLPADDASSPTAASIATVVGVDDAGLVVLDALLAQLKNDDATLFLLYAPNPSTTATGLFSDPLGAATAMVQTNLSTLSNSGAPMVRAERAQALLSATTGSPTYVAPLTSAAAFLQMLWECSIVRSGGYYLRYAPVGGGVLPPTLFSNGPTATLTLLVVLKSQNAAHAPILPFNSCAVVGDNIDAASSNVFVQPATWLVVQPSALADAAAFAAKTFGLSLAAADVATLNADVPQLLRPGALVQTAAGTDTVRIDDTLTTLATRNGVTPAALAAFGTNSTASILAPTGLVQFTAGALTRSAAFEAGNAGFQLTRPNPDPGNQQTLTAMDGDTIVDELYNMLVQRIVPNATGPAGFLRSGEGVPTGPAQSVPTENGGNVPSDVPNDRWDYHQAVAIAPFATSAWGSASPALPAAAQNPYAGVAPDASVTFAFRFADPFGNQLAMPADAQTLTQSVRYFDPLAGIARWPSAACAYALAGDGTADPSIVVTLSMQLDKYSVSRTTSAERAAQNTGADIVTYARAYYQLSQPDVGFALSTTLEAPVQGAPVSHTLDPRTFLSFVTSAWVALDALTATQPATVTGGTSFGSVAADYDVAVADVFTANGARLYSAVFGTAPLTVPRLYTTVNGDSLESIATAQGITQALLVQQNPWAALDPANDLAAPSRTVQPGATDALADIARAEQSSVSGIAAANSLVALTDGIAMAVAGVVIETKGDTFATLVPKFAAQGIEVTVGGIAVANQTVPGIFVTPVTLTVDDIVPLPLDSLGSLQQRFGFAMETLAEANAALPNLFAAGTSLYVGAGDAAPVPPAGTTLAQFASNEGVPLDGLGRALWNGLQPASPAAVNADVPLAAGAVVEIPATIVNPGTDRHATYRAQPTDTDLGTIAARFAGNDPGQLGTLSVDLPGLFKAGAAVVDKASGTSVPSAADSTFASLVAAFAAGGHTVTAASLAADNATTPDLVQPGGVWITPPMIAVGQSGGAGDTLARIAARFGTDVVTVARLNAGVLGFIVAGVVLPTVGGISHTTTANDTLNALIGIYTPPGTPAPAIDALATAFADVALVAPGALVLPTPLQMQTSVQVAASFADPIVPLGVTIMESRHPDWVDSAFLAAPDVLSTSFAVPAQTVGQDDADDPNVLSLDTFAAVVEAALPGVRVATGDTADVNDDPAQRTLWLVNFASPRGPSVGYTFEDASALRSFAIPPISTSLASGTVAVTPYVSGTGLDGTPTPIVFAGVDLDTWGASFLEAMDLALTPVYAVPMQEASLTDFDTLVNAKRTLATSISGRVQYVLDGGGPGEYGNADPRRAAAIAAMNQALLVSLSNAYTIESVVQAAVDVKAPYTDPVTAPRISGKAVLTQPGQGQPVKNASLSTAKVPLAATAAGAPATASFLLTVQAPATDRSIQATIGYAVAEIERPVGPPDASGYQVSSWLTLVHPLESSAGTVADVTLPIPLRAYPSPSTALSQEAARSVTPAKTVDDMVRWDASAVWQHQDADQDQTALKLEVGNATPGVQGRMLGVGSTDQLFAALAQFTSTWPAVKSDLALFTASLPGAAPSAAAAGALSAFAQMASAAAEAWPSDAVVPQLGMFASLAVTDEIVPGTYEYTLTRPAGAGTDLTTLTVAAGAANPAALWPALAVDDGSGMQALTLTSSAPSEAVYTYPSGIAKGQSLRYEATVPKLDVVMIPDFELGTSITRNADLVEGTDTSPLFIYRTPYTGFSSPLIPLLQIDEDFDIGGGTTQELAASLQAFLEALLARPAAATGSQRTLRIAASYGYQLTLPPTSGAANAVRGLRSGVTAGDSGLVPRLPIALIPAIELTINGDNNASIDTLASELAGFIVTWDGQVQPSHLNASLFFEVSLFSANAGSHDKPLLVARSVRYAL